MTLGLILGDGALHSSTSCEPGAGLGAQSTLWTGPEPPGDPASVMMDRLRGREGQGWGPWEALASGFCSVKSAQSRLHEAGKGTGPHLCSSASARLPPVVGVSPRPGAPEPLRGEL